jgi:hypothetical protein
MTSPSPSPTTNPIMAVTAVTTVVMTAPYSCRRDLLLLGQPSKFNQSGRLLNRRRY